MVLGWAAYFSRNHPTICQVWRPISDANFKLVGQTPAYRSWKVEEKEITLQPKDRFLVNAGDVIGVYFPSSSTVYCEYYVSHDCTRKHHTRQIPNAGHSTVGRVVTLNSANGCRRYPLRVILTGKVFGCSCCCICFLFICWGLKSLWHLRPYRDVAKVLVTKLY